MSDRTILVVKKRDGLGKGANRRLRVNNLVPGIFYTSAGENIAVEVGAAPVAKAYATNGRTTVFDLEIENDGKKSKHPVLFWQMQRHPTKSHFTHVDFYGVDLDKPVKIMVPVIYTGTASGTKLGGRVETYREKLLLMAKPLDMPSRIEYDITALDIGNTTFVADMSLPTGVKAVYDTNFAMVSVIQPGGAEAETEADA